MIDDTHEFQIIYIESKISLGEVGKHNGRLNSYLGWKRTMNRRYCFNVKIRAYERSINRPTRHSIKRN